MANILYYFSNSISSDFYGMMQDEALKDARLNGHKVYFTMCDTVLTSCLLNPGGNEQICKLCQSTGNSTLNKALGDSVEALYLKDYLFQDHSNHLFEYSSASEMKKLEYKGVKVGYSVLSTYIHLTRNQNPLINTQSKAYFDKMLIDAMKLCDTLEAILKEKKIDKVVAYNGRFSETRPAFEIAKSLNLEVLLYEGVWKDGKLFKVAFNNVLPHNVKDNLWRVDKCWDSYSEKEAIGLGHSFFNNRRTGVVAGDKVYINSQKEGKVPNNWDDSKTNIVIFNSSEDEFMAIGYEYEELAKFDTQLTGIKTILKEFDGQEDYQFYIRVHPNLSSVKYKYHTDLYKLEDEFSNVEVIHANDDISTYGLMDKADKVIVFGSSMGLEASYWGKPTILLGWALYYYSEVCYIPNSKEELFIMIKESLKPINNLNQLKMGLYLYKKEALFIDGEEQFKYLDYNSKQSKLFGLRFRSNGYQKYLGSERLAGFKVAVKRFLALRLGSNRYVMPKDEA